MYPHEKSDSKKNYFIAAIVFHLILIVSVFVFKNFDFSNSKDLTEAPPESSIIESGDVSNLNEADEVIREKKKQLDELEKNSLEATTIDSKEVDNAIKNFQQEEINKKAQAEQERQAEIERIKNIEREKIKKEKEAIELAKKKKLEQEKKKQEKIKKEKEEKQKQLEKKKQEELNKKKLEQAKLKREEEKAKREELAEKARKDAAEKKRKSAEAIKKAQEAKRIAAKNRGYNSNTKSISNNEKLALLREYRDNVYNKVYSNWMRPSYSKRGWDCRVHVTQSSRGEVVDVKIVQCQGNLEFQNSVKRAIFKSSPLPLPKHPSLFDNTIEITFKVT